MEKLSIWSEMNRMSSLNVQTEGKKVTDEFQVKKLRFILEWLDQVMMWRRRVHRIELYEDFPIVSYRCTRHSNECMSNFMVAFFPFFFFFFSLSLSLSLSLFSFLSFDCR